MPAAVGIFKQAQKKAKFHHIDVDATVKATGAQRSDIVSKLNQWNDDGVVNLKTSGLVNVYTIVKPLPATAAQRLVIADTLFAQMHKREQQDLARTKDVVDLVTGMSCISRGLAKYFGDDSVGLSDECGHCSWCETHMKVTIPPRTPAVDDHGAVGKILKECPERNDPRFLARIAFGIKSPRITALKYSNKAIFASLSEHDFPVSTTFDHIMSEAND